MNLYIGIDPGLKGGIAVVDENGNWFQLQDTPTNTFKKGKKVKTEYNIVEIRKVLSNFSNCGPDKVRVFLEKMQSMPPGIRVQASFSLGYSQGLFEGILSTLELSYQLVVPKTWQKHFQITKAKGDKKVQSFQIASRLFPTAELTGPRGGQKDGRSDALLIAEWGRRNSSYFISRERISGEHL